MPGDVWISQVEAACRGRGLQMTTLRRDVVQIFAQAHQPLGAYAIIQKLSEAQNRIVAPPTVYRTLDFLVENGFVLKIESRQAYVACDHVGHEHDHHGIVLSCTKCGRTAEIESPTIDKELTAIADKLGFTSDRAVCEVDGICADCGGA